MLPNFIRNEDITNISIYPDREKVNGRMWDGNAIAQIKGTTINLQLWHHGAYDYNQPEISLIREFTIKMVNGKDAYWHCLWDHNSLWIHYEGWFNNHELRESIPQVNPNINIRMLPIEQLKALGFIQLF